MTSFTGNRGPVLQTMVIGWGSRSCRRTQPFPRPSTQKALPCPSGICNPSIPQSTGGPAQGIARLRPGRGLHSEAHEQRCIYTSVIMHTHMQIYSYIAYVPARFYSSQSKQKQKDGDNSTFFSLGFTRAPGLLLQKHKKAPYP